MQRGLHRSTASSCVILDIRRVGARIKLMRCIELGGREVDSSKLQAPAAQSKPLAEPFENGALSDRVASPSVLRKVLCNRVWIHYILLLLALLRRARADCCATQCFDQQARGQRALLPEGAQHVLHS